MKATDLARLLDNDFERHKRHVFTFINHFRWEGNAYERLKMVSDEPTGVSADVKALVASLVEYLCRESGLETPEWAKDAPPASKAVYLTSDDVYMIWAIRDAPVVFKKRMVFISENVLKA
jgi:hypothetical protein